MYEEGMRYFWFAERWHWTADQVDNSPQWLVDRWPGIAQMYDEVRAEQEEARARSKT